MADEIDTDYSGKAVRRPTIEDLREQLKTSKLPRPEYDLIVKQQDGRTIIAAGGGWYLFDEETQQPDFSQPADPPPWVK